MAHYEASRPFTELRNGLRDHYREQIDRAGRAVLAVAAEPRATYRLRVTQAAAREAPDVMELAGRELFSDARPMTKRWLRIIFDEAGLDPAFTIRRTDAAKAGWRLSTISRLRLGCTCPPICR